MTKNTLREEVYLAALLHDIGKFYQRADTGAVKSSKFLKEKAKNLEQIICPQYKGYSSHKHVLWTAQFILDFEKVFNNLVGNTELNQLANNQNLLHLTADHHLSSDQLSFEGRIIREADHLSSGMDRTSDEAFQDEQDESKWDSFKTKRMVSIFEGILKEKQSHKYHLPVEAINLNDTFNPKAIIEGYPDYETLWKDFINEFKFLQQENYRAFSETLLNLLNKYTCTIPSSTINFPDVSLFDHLKTTAAIAVCLYDWEKSEKNLSNKTAPFLMIGADFSGIQNYIYNIISKNAAKNLKGRSFYLKLMSDSIVTLILQELDLFEANVIYNAGGGFFILAPNTSFVNEKLAELKQAIENKIFETHGTSIFVAIDSISIGKETLMGKTGFPTIGECWTTLFEKRDIQKKQRYKNRIIQDYDLFFKSGEAGGITRRDAITGDEIQANAKNIYTIDGKKANSGSTEMEVVQELTYKQISLGRKLKQAEVWVVSNQPLNYWPEKEAINPGNLGIYYYFLSKKDLDTKAEKLKSSADWVKIIAINSNSSRQCNFLNSAIQGSNNVYGFEFFGGNDYPADENGDPKFFDELAGEDGFRRLGVLRMDVDNLGNIFQNGIKSKQSTFSRYAALSRNLDWFFKGYINTIWNSEFKDTTYIVYSGGDDLFIVGHWNECIAFAEKIKTAFKLFTCENENLSISGGLAIVSPKYPIKKAAQESAEAEKSAKNYKEKINGKIENEKNAICFLGYPMCWEIEYPVIKDIKTKMVKLLEAEKLPKSFISKLHSHFLQAEIQNDGKLKIPPRMYWMMAYDFGRMILRTKNPAAIELIEQCKMDIVKDCINGKRFENYHALQLWHLAARWAELEYRSSKQ